MFPAHLHTGKYNLTERGDGSISHVVNVNGSPDKTYTVTLMSRGKPVKSVSSLTAVEIKFEWLKPCTIYTISVNACEPDGDVTFISSGKCFNTYSNSKFRWDILYTDLKNYLDT